MDEEGRWRRDFGDVVRSRGNSRDGRSPDTHQTRQGPPKTRVSRGAQQHGWPRTEDDRVFQVVEIPTPSPARAVAPPCVIFGVEWLAITRAFGHDPRADDQRGGWDVEGEWRCGEVLGPSPDRETL